ncbi:MAG: hypothetical protein WDM76_03840 [Limisphaerales bacterium]
MTSSLHYTNVFGALWDQGTPFYNQYASILSTNTDAYSFPFNDTLAKPLLPLQNNPTLTIEILPDTPPSFLQPYFSGVHLSNDIITLAITNLTPGTSNNVQRATVLGVSNGWENVVSFVATGVTTNYNEVIQPTNAFFRIKVNSP